MKCEMNAGLYITEIINELTFVKNSIREGDCTKLVDTIQQSQHAFCYDLEYASSSVRTLTMCLVYMGKEVYFLTETITSDSGPGDLFTVSSTSGETAQLVVLAKKARQFGGAVAVLATNRHTTIAEFIDAIIQIDAPSKNQKDSVSCSAQLMMSLYKQALLVITDALVMKVTAESGAPENELLKRHVNLEQSSPLFARHPTGE